MKINNKNHYRRFFTLCITVALFISCNNSEPVVEEEQVDPLEEIDISIQGNGSHQVVSYLRADKALEYLDDNYYDNVSHIIILAHPEVNNNGHIVVSSELDEILKQAILRREGRKTKILLGLGGGNEFYKPLIDDVAKLDNYITDIKNICVGYNLDGFDLDWEHPEGAELQMAAGVFAKRAYEILKPEGLLLTQAIIWYNIGHMKAVVDYLDYINVMIYGNFDSKHFHSPLSQYKMFVDRILDNGLPKDKILAGIPFYGFFAVEAWSGKGGNAYFQILERYEPKLGSDWVTTPNGVILSFDGVIKVWKKCVYALEKDLAGVMIFETWMDVPDFSSEESLMRQVNHVFPIDNN